MADIVVVTVQYRNFDDTNRLARSLDRLQDSSDIEFLVVDNAADAESTRQLTELAESVGFRVRILSPQSNLYYWGGAAFALQQIRSERAALPLWVIVCNNDIAVPREDFFALLSGLDPIEYPIVAPDIVSVTTGKRQNPILARRPGTLKRLKWRVYDVNYRIAQSMLTLHRGVTGYRRNVADRQVEQSEKDTIFAPHGACVIFSSEFFARGGELDTAVPMFAEELTLAAQAEKLALPVRYVPSLKIDHREHSTTGAGLTREKYEMERAARRRYYELAAS